MESWKVKISSGTPSWKATRFYGFYTQELSHVLTVSEKNMPCTSGSRRKKEITLKSVRVGLPSRETSYPEPNNSPKGKEMPNSSPSTILLDLRGRKNRITSEVHSPEAQACSD